MEQKKSSQQRQAFSFVADLAPQSPESIASAVSAVGPTVQQADAKSQQSGAETDNWLEAAHQQKADFDSLRAFLQNRPTDNVGHDLDLVTRLETLLPVDIIQLIADANDNGEMPASKVIEAALAYGGGAADAVQLILENLALASAATPPQMAVGQSEETSPEPVQAAMQRPTPATKPDTSWTADLPAPATKPASPPQSALFKGSPSPSPSSNTKTAFDNKLFAKEPPPPPPSSNPGITTQHWLQNATREEEKAKALREEEKKVKALSEEKKMKALEERKPLRHTCECWDSSELNLCGLGAVIKRDDCGKWICESHQGGNLMRTSLCLLCVHRPILFEGAAANTPIFRGADPSKQIGTVVYQ